MSRWRELLDRRSSSPGASAASAASASSATEVSAPGESTETLTTAEGTDGQEPTGSREFAVALVGSVSTVVERLRDDPGGQWPLVESLSAAPASPLVPHDVRADALWFLLRGVDADWQRPARRIVSLAEACDARVVALVALDVAPDADESWLEGQLRRAADELRGAASRARLQRLAGPAVVRQLTQLMRDPAVDRVVRSSAARALPTIVLNAPVGGVLAEAVAVASELADGDRYDRRLAGRVLRELALGAPLLAHGFAEPLDEERLANLAGNEGWRISVAALDLLGAMPGGPRPSTVETLLRIAATGGSTEELALPGAERALACLAKARRQPNIVALVRDLAERGSSASIRREAAAALVGLLGDEARDVWLDLLASTKVGDIAAGERLLRRFGTAQDVPLALLAAHRLLRRRAGEPSELRYPPRGAELLAFLEGHRGQVEVDALFVEVRARWDHLPPELRGWISEHLPWLGPLA